jgi:hypothetical protein
VEPALRNSQTVNLFGHPFADEFGVVESVRRRDFMDDHRVFGRQVNRHRHFALKHRLGDLFQVVFKVGEIVSVPKTGPTPGSSQSEEVWTDSSALPVAKTTFFIVGHGSCGDWITEAPGANQIISGAGLDDRAEFNNRVAIFQKTANTTNKQNTGTTMAMTQMTMAMIHSMVATTKFPNPPVVAVETARAAVVPP